MRLKPRGRARRPTERSWRLLYATDFHAGDVVLRKFLNAISVYEANVAVIGGDLTGVQANPADQQPGGRWPPVRAVTGGRDLRGVHIGGVVPVAFGDAVEQRRDPFAPIANAMCSSRAARPAWPRGQPAPGSPWLPGWRC